MEFSSPLINTLLDKGDYARFIQDPLFYLQSELIMVKEGNLRSGTYPIGKLGMEGDYVQIQFVHNVDFGEAKQQWDRRKKRINKGNLLVKMGFSISDKNVNSYIEAFRRCPHPKILFYNGEEDIDGKISTERFVWYERKKPRVDYFNYFDYMRHGYQYVIDILKLLTGEGEYSRESFPR